MKNYLKEKRLSMLSIEQCIDNVAKGKLPTDAAKEIINSTISQIVKNNRFNRDGVKRAIVLINESLKELE